MIPTVWFVFYLNFQIWSVRVGKPKEPSNEKHFGRRVELHSRRNDLDSEKLIWSFVVMFYRD